MVTILKYLKPKEWALIGISILFIVTQVWLDLELPGYMSEITRLVQIPGSEMSEIIAAGGWMLLCALGSLATSIIVAGIAAKIAANFSSRLRSKLFDKVQSFSMEEINNFSTASLITRSTNDITQVQMLIVIGLQLLVKAPILAVWAMLKITGKSWQWSLATGVAIGVLILIVGIVIVLVLPKFQKLQQLTDNLNRVARENLTGLRVIRAYNAESYQEDKFSVANSELTRTNLFANNVLSMMMPSISLIMSGLSLAIYWIGAILIQNANGTAKMGLFSDMIVFSSYAMQVVMAFMMLIMIFILMPRAHVSAKRINEVLDTKPSLENGSLTSSKANRLGEVEFKNVSFKYPDAEEYVIEDISFTVKKGETVAFIGSTGCGKSTVVNLIPRFYDATAGEVLVDGINVNQYEQTALRNKMGYVSQKAILFGGTVSSNVAFGDNGSDLSSDVVDAIYTSQASDFVEKMEGSYEAHVSQGGTNLSGGQKQRLSIARAIARRPEILIFDDSFSALDYKTDRKLRSELKKKSSGTTILIVAQRIGTIKDADKIIVLEAGRMAGMGTHDELMQTCDVYQEIAYSQLSKEELA
ncbi:ABC transporter ATP-binding protein [Paenibacillus sp. FSL R7-0048]|jgi:ATP-binding cassette subfamily B multidrug efflux pump|uniref:Multidrug ABC transporter ATP-binding protein n=1 Tax=Paenibacillus odorifer TaxID=189426 RepID=A0ABX3GLI6_9BACL|nr:MULTISPECIES: ABC transporter ATP-binding protein [Paenibacillus]MDH6427538.1 ATP-binding cassette subfamily B multidrug efflux pump [Paenibacillus sp. PastH-4]MDH6443568.1 ATP-binding cassette subfamily B multidrug efflux pump [Paenibacillus sp. PastF-4]MDH6525728.1 ATP-binding cassette subfamily B multidrug efflux pump [Paenibacillus sp. PastH-3]OMC70175.1 multidrug ABC transporter ATP-binding protein [Paenibacillus odorifer]OMD31900.1 multidrug ABC transporter ATP-binding protein [Paenib